MGIEKSSNPFHVEPNSDPEKDRLGLLSKQYADLSLAKGLTLAELEIVVANPSLLDGAINALKRSIKNLPSPVALQKVEGKRRLDNISPRTIYDATMSFPLQDRTERNVGYRLDGVGLYHRLRFSSASRNKVARAQMRAFELAKQGKPWSEEDEESNILL